MSATRRGWGRVWAGALVTAGSLGAAAATAHSVCNSALLRRPGDRSGAGPPGGGPSGTGWPEVSVLLPVRDEAHRVGPCLRSLLAQDPRDVPEILVCDDGSTDGTADVVRRIAGTDPRVRLLTGTEPPAGWLGKPHACQQLAEAADPGHDVLVFLDADVELTSGAVAGAVGLLRRTGLDLVCPYPRQLTGSPAERVVQPLLQWSWLTFLPLRLAERSPRESLSAANGQFLLVRRDAYRRAGGHTAVRGEVLDDIALLRAVKRAGGTGGVVDGSTLATCRMYRGWGELSDGYAKSLWSAFGSPAGATGALGLLGLLYVLPALAALCGSRVGLAGYLAGVAGRAVTARRTGARVWPDALAHPVSVGTLGWLTVQSWRRRRAGTLVWKRRVLL
ncbi:MAG TPA: glycosyltransferase family 2 protein [Mycobacteriales bacterium]|nr:glycosyltransferase family 2 protein [Mycobacteriales bacterium]